MRPVFCALLMLLPGLVLAATPEEGFEAIADAVYDGDAGAFMEGLSEANLQQLEMMVAMVKMSPGDAAEQLSSELGEEITGDEIMQWTAEDMVAVLIAAPQLQEQLPPREVLQVARCETDGDSATVYLVVPEVEEELPILMVREGDVWKLGEPFMNMGG